MKYAKFGLIPLAAALMTGCGQETADTFNNALEAAKAKMAGQAGAASAQVPARAKAPDVEVELLALKQQLAQVQNKLATSNAALQAAQNKLRQNKLQSNNNDQRAKLLRQDQAQLQNDRRLMDATSRHVRQLESQLSQQDIQLQKLQKTLLDTEAGCREVAEELARST